MSGEPLQSHRREKFCQLYVKGPTAGNATAAYRAAGFKDTESLSSNAYKFLKIPEIQARIAELRRDAREAAPPADNGTDRQPTGLLVQRREAVLAEIAAMGFAKITDYVRETPDGELTIDLAAVERDKAAGVVELSITERGEGEKRTRHVRIKLGQKLAALATLGRHLGLFVGPQEDPHGEQRQLSADELQQRLADVDRQLARFGAAGAAAGQAPPEAGALPPPGAEEA